MIDINIRNAEPADSASIAWVHVDSWRTAYRGIISQSYLESLSYEHRRIRWLEAIENLGNIVLVAEDRSPSGSVVIGFIRGCANRYKERFPTFTGELGAVYILEEYLGRGIGTSLVRSLVKGLVERNYHSMLVWVLAKNPYRGFYEALGGEYLGSQQIQIGSDSFEEVAYGWKDLKRLLKDSQIALKDFGIIFPHGLNHSR